MSLLSKIRCITLDVTGTLIAYKGELDDYYCMAAKSVGLPCPDFKRVHEGFKLAYKYMATKYPCFGYHTKMPKLGVFIKRFLASCRRGGHGSSAVV